LAPSHRLKLLQAFTKNLLTYGEFRKCFQDDLLELKRLTQRMLRLSYLERQYESDFSDTITLMDEMFPEFTLKRNGHSKKVDDAIIKYLRMPTVSDAINLTQMKTRFDYVEKGKRDELRKVQHNVIELRSRQITQEMNSIYSKILNRVRQNKFSGNNRRIAYYKLILNFEKCVNSEFLWYSFQK
jgi:hypothetical protein